MRRLSVNAWKNTRRMKKTTQRSNKRTMPKLWLKLHTRSGKSANARRIDISENSTIWKSVVRKWKNSRFGLSVDNSSEKCKSARALVAKFF